MATRESLNQNSPLVELTGLILSYVILKAETADFAVRQHKLFGTTIEVGDRTFNNMDESKAVEQFLRWIIERETTMSREHYDNVVLDEKVPEDIDAVAEKFAEGGMSEFGQMVERERRRLANGEEPDATEPVTGSDDKPN